MPHRRVIFIFLNFHYFINAFNANYERWYVLWVGQTRIFWCLVYVQFVSILMLLIEQSLVTVYSLHVSSNEVLHCQHSVWCGHNYMVMSYNGGDNWLEFCYFNLLHNTWCPLNTNQSVFERSLIHLTKQILQLWKLKYLLEIFI